MPLPLWLVLAALVSVGRAAPHSSDKPVAPKGAPAAAAPAQTGTLFPERSTAPIVVVWPPEGLSMPSADGEFVFGSVSEPGARFTINGASVPVHANGAFLAWLPVSPGTFTFRCSLDLKGEAATLSRNISVGSSAPPLPAQPLALDADSLWPRARTDLRPGDWMTFRLRGSPGKQAQCRLGKGPWQDLIEPSPGHYEGPRQALAGESQEPAPVECRLKSGWTSVRALSRGSASVSSGAPAVAATKGSAILRTGPGNGYMAFPLPGTRLALAGRSNGEFKAELAPGFEGWIDEKDLDLLPAGTAPPRAVTGAIRTEASERGAVVRIPLTERVVFTVDESDELSALTLRLFNTAGYTNWIVYDSADAFVEEVRWKQESSGVVAIRIRLNRAMTLWGWQASYEGTTFKLDLRRAPALAPAPASALQGLSVMLDPGHMPSAPGALGPMGTKEMDANLAIAHAVAGALSRRGALPALTRASAAQELALLERPRIAVDRKADIFLSLHNNALSDGENPFSRPHGYSVFYYHPHSLALARQMYRAYGRHVPLPGEDLRYGNLLVARLSAMPAILIENAYMIFPEQEALLSDPAFRGKLAEAVADGLESFLDAERGKQAAGKPQPASSKKKAKPRKPRDAAGAKPAPRRRSTPAKP